MILAIDHVIVPVANLTQAAAELEARYGLASVEGGRHPAWGTANRIVPLGDAYLELVAVDDPEVASHAAFGSWIAAAPSGRPLGWAVRTDAIDTIAERLDLAIVPGSRVTGGGGLITWRSAGVDVAIREPELPFFIEWGDGTVPPGATVVRHPVGRANLSSLALTGDPARLGGWLGEHALPIALTPGPSGVSVLSLVLGNRLEELRNLVVDLDGTVPPGGPSPS